MSRRTGPRRVMRAALALLVGALALLSLATAAQAADAAHGAALLLRKGCLSCHSTDGSRRAGPSLQGLYATSRVVTTDGQRREIVADEPYLARSVRDPDADVVVGFPRGTMPKFALSDDEVASIVLAIEVLGSPSAPPLPGAEPPRAPAAMGWLAFYALWFVGLHLLLSRVGLRERIVARIGPSRFGILYSALATIGLVGMILSFRSAPYVEVWLPPRALRWVPVLTMPVALFFLVAGFSTQSPTVVGQGAVAGDAKGPVGILTVTRHPALWGFALWGLAHLATNGELRAILLFVAIVTLAFAGMVHIDRRRAAALGDTWMRYTERTSLLPFAAILRGKVRLDWRGIGLVRIAVTGFAYVAILHMHTLVIGASPMP